ncbi:hypothetical protein Ddc_06490 [Ditylenchus destructor]|nr:hypothetical protein Ddc_06490 [Ditylenchus destructor]
MFNSNHSLLSAMISSSPQLSALFTPALSTIAPTSGGSTQLQQQLTAAALAANNLLNAQYNTSNCVSPPNDFSSALLLIQAQQQLAAETAAPLFNNTSLSQPQQHNFNSFVSQIAPPPSYETAIQQQNLQHHKLLSSLSTSTLMGQQTTAIQSPDILRLTQVTIKDEEDQQQQLQSAIFANFLNNNVGENNANAARITNEDADNANMPVDVVSEEQQQEDEERLDEEPLDLSIRRNSKKKTLINRSHADPCTSDTAATPGTLRGSVIQNHGLMPGREVKRSASSVSYRAVEPDVQEHFRRSLSGKWPRRHNHAQVHCASPYSAIGSSVASVSSISAQSQDSSDQLSFKLSPTEEIAPAFPTNVDALPAYYRKKSLSSSSSISAPPCTAPPPPPSAINPHAQTRRSFNGYSSAKSPVQGSSRMVATQIIISENGVNQVEEHFRRSFQAMQEKQRKLKESQQKSAQNDNLQNSSIDGNLTNQPQQ